MIASLRIRNSSMDVHTYAALQRKDVIPLLCLVYHTTMIVVDAVDIEQRTTAASREAVLVSIHCAGIGSIVE